MKAIELSLSPKYVTNWGLIESVREILQNAIDCETDGNKVDVTYNNEILSISTYGSSLDRKTLLLGESGKNDSRYIGKYGEGYKLALLVLNRIGKKTIVFTKNEMWTTEFKKSKVFEEESMFINIEEYNISSNEEYVKFEIHNITQSDMFKLRDNFIVLDRYLGRSIGATRESEYGEVLLNKEYSGKFYVNGLFVQNDTEFTYGYNFKSEYVNLDRDRKAINYYELKELTARTLTSSGDVSLLEDGLRRKIVDLDDEEEVLNNLTYEQSINFKKFYYDKYNLDSDTYVGTDKMIEISGKEKVKSDNKIITKILFKADDKEDEYYKTQSKIKNKNDYESAVIAFNDSGYKKAYILYKKIEKKLNKKEKEEMLSILKNHINKPYGFDLIEKDIDSLCEYE